MENQEKQIQEMQFLEQNIHNMLLQKQAFQMELSETVSALKEIKGSKGDVHKMIGQLMIKTDKKKIEEELTNKEKMLELRLKTLEEQEKKLSAQADKLRGDLMKSLKK